MEVYAKTANAADSKRGVSYPQLPILPARMGREGGQHGFLDIEPVEGSLRQWDDLAVHTD